MSGTDWFASPAAFSLHRAMLARHLILALLSIGLLACTSDRKPQREAKPEEPVKYDPEAVKRLDLKKVGGPAPAPAAAPASAPASAPAAATDSAPEPSSAIRRER
jgi:hypothetical protein